MALTDAPKIVTGRFEHPDSFTLDRYLATEGYEGLRRALAMEPAAVIDEVFTATVQGRGGAGFPAGNKWKLIPEGKYPRWVVVNGDESEPGTYKDRELMERDPHQVIEGALICAYAIGASQIFLYIRGEMALAQERVISAVNEAYAKGYLGKNVLGTDWSIDLTVHWGAGAYIVGDETALLESLEGKRGMPRLKPPYFPAVQGLYFEPTIVNNVETMSNLPWILRNGGAAYAELGTENTRGTKMIAVSGHVKKPGVYEIECGKVTFRDVFYDPALGGGIRDDNELKAFIPGGGSAPWFFPEQLDTPLDPRAVGALGSMLGSSAIVAMDSTTDMVRAAWRLVRFYAKESCGKCTPCREGTTWLERIYQRILSGNGRPEDIDLLMDVCDNIAPGPFPGPPVEAGGQPFAPFPWKKTTICDLGPSAGAALYSSIRRFRDEYDAYIARNTRTFIPVLSAGSGAIAPDPADRTAAEEVAAHG